MINENIIISGEGLNIWFNAMIKKYPNSIFKNHLESVWMAMAGETIQDDSLQTFFEKDYSKDE